LGIDRNEEAYFSSAQEDDEEEDLDRDSGPANVPTTDALATDVLAADVLAADEMDIPHKMATTWLSEEDLDRTKRMKY
jgi:hypothetical protein